MRRTWVIAGGLLVVTAVAWPLLFNQFFNFRIPADWSYQARFLGDIAAADAAGNIPAKRDVVIYERTQRVGAWTPATAVIEDVYTVLDAKTGAIVWQGKRKFPLDPRTGKMRESPEYPGAAGLYFLFPQDVEKRDYRFFTYYLAAYTLRFDRVEAIGGIETYVFKFFGDMDVTRSYEGTDEFPGLHPPPGQAIKSAGLLNELWVDPATGELLKFKEASGLDAFVDAATGRTLLPISTWGGATTLDSTSRAAQQVAALHTRRQLNLVWIPLILAAAGIAAIVVGVRLKKA